MIRRLALGIVRRYPVAWRERYEAEVRALIEESPARLRDLGELLRGLITERTRELMSATDKPKRTAAVLTWMPAVFMVIFTAVAVALGMLLQRVSGPFPAAHEETLGVAFASFMLLLLAVQFVTIVRHARRPFPKPPMAHTPAWLACLLLPAAFMAIVFASWAAVLFAGNESSSLPWALHAFFRGYLYFLVLSHLTSSLWPGRELLQTLGALEAAEGHLKTNEAWVQSCHEWLAKGVPSPLADAEAQVERWTSECHMVPERLEPLADRSRFRGV